MAGLRITITPQFSISTELMHFSFRLADVEHSTVSRAPGSSVVTLPERVWGGVLTPGQRAWLRSVATEEIRLHARRYLPARLREIAATVGARVEGVTVKNLSSRWGSCSTRSHVNLNLWLMLAPTHLIDYVIMHELCHLREMNHGPRFWALLDEYAGGRARQLDREMRQFGKSLR